MQRENVMYFRAALVIVAFLLSRGLYAAAETNPQLRIEATAIVAAGFTPGGNAVVFGVVQEPHRYWWTLVRHAEVIPVANDGTIRYESPSAVDRSFWAVVDLSNGAVAVGVPEGAQLRPAAAKPQSFRTDSAGLIDAFVSSRESVEILCVRPGVGAWALSNGDGGENDSDGAVNGSTMTYADAMKPLGDSPAAPASLLPHDIIIAVDPESMTFVSTEIKP